MKIAVLIITIFLVIVFFRFYKKINLKNNSKKNKSNIIDLEKDPNTNEYKPKE